MKILVTYLLAIYVIALSCIPCQDDTVAADEVSVTTVSKAGDTHREIVDLCSPLCICACCASVTVSTVIAVLPESPVMQLVTSTGFSYLHTCYTGDRAGIWQPPQNRV